MRNILKLHAFAGFAFNLPPRRFSSYFNFRVYMDFKIPSTFAFKDASRNSTIIPFVDIKHWLMAPGVETIFARRVDNFCFFWFEIVAAFT